METNKKLIHTHIFNGGTMITNFGANRLPQIKQAIEEYAKINPKHGLVLSDLAYDNTHRLLKGYWSLHHLEPSVMPDLSEFWNIFERIKNDTEKTDKEKLLNEKIDNLLTQLDAHAVSVDSCDFGLPIDEYSIEPLRAIVKDFLATLK